MQACQAQTQCRAGAGYDCMAPDCRPSSAGAAAMSGQVPDAHVARQCQC
jgi:hypothetical protein